MLCKILEGKKVHYERCASGVKRKFARAAVEEEDWETFLPIVEQTCEKRANLFARAHKRLREFPWGPNRANRVPYEGACSYLVD